MTRKILPFLFLTAVFSCRQFPEEEAPKGYSEWEFKMVASGNNRPVFEPAKDSIHYLPILLHQDFTVGDISKRLGWNKEELQAKIAVLLDNGFLKQTGDTYRPSLMVVSEKAAGKIRAELNPVAEEIARAILIRRDSISEKVKAIDCFADFSMDALSLLVFSNILLDNGQLNNIEHEYLKSSRPERNGNRYYASYQEKTRPSFEALGIYGNHVQPTKDFVLCRYGNQRYTQDVMETNDQILQDYRNLEEGEAFDYPIVTPDCAAEIQQLADYFKPDLLSLLHQHDSFLRKGYQASPYAKEVTYEEYFMWVYHILYSQVTDLLIASKDIIIPPEKVSFYIYQP